MKRQQFFLLMMTAAVLFSGCAPKLKLHVKQPGEMNVEGVSKIAILGFDTVNHCPGSKQYPVGPDTLKLAEKCMTDVFYSVPFFAFSDLCLEPCLESCNFSKRASRFDALVYGKVWWEISKEYDNIKPETFQLETREAISFICEVDKKGNKKSCITLVPKETRDEPVLIPYRAVTASLMLSLSIYKINADGQDGRVRKLTQVSEIASQRAIVINGQFHLLEPQIVGREGKKDQVATLRGEAAKGRHSRGVSLNTQTTTQSADRSASATSGDSLKGVIDNAVDSLFKGLLPKTSDDRNQQAQAGKPNTPLSQPEMPPRTIPAKLQLQADTMSAIARILHERVAPHESDFEVSLPLNMDNAASNLLNANAYTGAVHYIVLKKLANGYADYCSFFYDAELERGAKEVVKRIHKDAFEKENKAAPPDKRKEYADLPDEKAAKQAKTYLSDRTTDLYVLGLALEALGSYDRALNIYRYLFYQQKGFLPTQGADQDYADGIGRCLFAMNMDKGLTEGQRKKRDALEKVTLMEKSL